MALAGTRFAFRPDLQLRVTAQKPRVLRHFEAEYAPARAAETEREPEAVASFLDRLPAGTVARGGYKTARWSVALSDPGAETLSVSIALNAWPSSFGLSLVQGYFVEPVLSVAAARSGYVLLPSAGLSVDGGALLLMGRSRMGKSSLAARALVAGRRLLGDDQILLDTSGRCWPFPRRLRLYSDLPRTAPGAFARLGRSNRAALRGRGLLRRATRGWATPPVRVSPAELAVAGAAGPLDVARVVVIERRAGVTELSVEAVDPASAVVRALDLLERQRSLLASASSVWARALEAVAAQEASTLAPAFARTSVEAVSVPDDWDAARAIGALASLFELDV